MLWFRLKGRPATPSPSLFSQERCVSHEPTGKTARPDRTVGRGRVHHLARDQQGGPSLLGALLGTCALLQTQRAPVFTCLIFHTDHPSHAPNTTKPATSTRPLPCPPAPLSSVSSPGCRPCPGPGGPAQQAPSPSPGPPTKALAKAAGPLSHSREQGSGGPCLPCSVTGPLPTRSAHSASGLSAALAQGTFPEAHTSTPATWPWAPGRPPVCAQGNAAHRGRDLASSFVLPSRPSATSGQGGREPRARSRPPRPTPGGTGPGARGASYLSSY